VSTPSAPSIAAVDRGLASFSDRIRGAARRSYWFSWLSWGFVFAVSACTVLLVLIDLEFAVTVTTTTASGTSTTTTGPWWGLPVAVAPAVALLALAIRELLLARREELRWVAVGGSPGTAPASASEGGWVTAVQQAQKTVTQIKNETEFSFLPLFLGMLGLGEIALGVSLSGLNLGLFSFVWVIGGAVPVCLLVVPLYLIARRWTRGYQALLDHQVSELSRLEAEFLWRFTGSSA
jgi:hypothetical protein